MGTYVLDHVAKNDNLREISAVMSILDGFMERSKKENPTLSYKSIFTEIDSNYPNSLVSVLIPFLNASHSVKLNYLIH